MPDYILIMGKIIIDYVLVFLMGMLGIWKAIPLGLLLKSHPFIIFLMTALGASSAVLILFFFGNKIRGYILRKRIKATMKTEQLNYSRNKVQPVLDFWDVC